MSLLEDVFLQNEADEAQELERVIEGDEYDDRLRPSTPNSDENSEKEDEAEEDKRRVDPTKAKEKRVVKNPRQILNPARMTGPRGIQIIPEHFKDFKFKGKGHEKEDLDLVLKRLEHWAYRLFPKFKFEDCLKKMETLGKKRPVMVHLHKIRSDQFTSEETVVQRESSDEEDVPAVQEEDEFDKLLQQQIELARATPAPGSVKKGFDTPRPDRSSLMPKATSSPSISDEQRERMLKNRQLAEERRLAKLKQNTATNDSVNGTQDKLKETEINDFVNEDIVTKRNRSNIIDSSDDDDCDITIVNQSVTVDVHKVGNDASKKDKIVSSDTRIDSEDIQIVEDDVACQGEIELVPTQNKGNNSEAEVEDNSPILLEDNDVACQGDIELISTKNDRKISVAEVEDNNQVILEDGEGDIQLDEAEDKDEIAPAEVEDSNMDIPVESNSNENSKQKGFINETEIDIDTILEVVNDSNTGNDASTVKQIPVNDMVMKNDKSDNENLNNSVENTYGNEINNDNKEKGNDDYGEDIDIMDVDFSEEF